MKRVYISVDIEGVTNVTDWAETTLGDAQHGAAARQMTAEAAAACRGALAAGADEVWVRDAHDSARNIDATKLPRGVRLIRGWECTYESMMEEIGNGFDCAIFIGYHSEAGSGENPLAHTINSSRMMGFRLNGKRVSELELNSYIAASHSVPIAFVSGDEGICRVAQQLLPGVGTLGVKRGSGEATISIHPEEACELIEEGVKKAVSTEGYRMAALPEKYELELQYKEHWAAKKAAQFPGARVIDEHTVGHSSSELKDMLVARMFMMS